jgi:hypothetical protein
MIKTLRIMGDALGIICIGIFFIGGLIEDLQMRCYDAYIQRLHR